jgi:hypothetical protein
MTKLDLCILQRMQSGEKGDRLSFATAPKIIWALLANRQRVIEHRMKSHENLEEIASCTPINLGNLLKGLKR